MENKQEDIYVGDEYRQLESDEILQSGDEYWDGIDAWVKTACVGEKQSECPKTYRRKAYRLLKRGELIKKGDEYRDWSWQWHQTGDYGKGNMVGDNKLTYRRKLISADDMSKHKSVNEEYTPSTPDPKHGNQELIYKLITTILAKNGVELETYYYILKLLEENSVDISPIMKISKCIDGKIFHK